MKSHDSCSYHNHTGSLRTFFQLCLYSVDWSSKHKTLSSACTNMLGVQSVGCSQMPLLWNFPWAPSISVMLVLLHILQKRSNRPLVGGKFLHLMHYAINTDGINSETVSPSHAKRANDCDIKSFWYLKCYGAEKSMGRFNAIGTLTGGTDNTSLGLIFSVIFHSSRETSVAILIQNHQHTSILKVQITCFWEQTKERNNPQ